MHVARAVGSELSNERSGRDPKRSLSSHGVFVAMLAFWRCFLSVRTETFSCESPTRL